MGFHLDESAVDSPEIVQLLEQVEMGDGEAFNRLFARFRNELVAFIEIRLDPKLRRRVDASDVVQETQLEAFRRMTDYLARRPMPFRLWLCKTAYERLLKSRRRHLGVRRRALGQEERLPDRSSLLLAGRLLEGTLTPSQHASRKETAQQVAQCLARLSEMDREILVMRNHEGRNYGEIACLLGIESAAARKRYGRALLRLRKGLVEAGVLEAGQ